MTFVDVIIPVPLDGLFTYSVPAELEGSVCPLVRVKVPFGITKTHTALVVRVHENAPQGDITIKNIVSVLDDTPILLPSQLKLWQWISSYYMSPLGDILTAALPHGIKKEEAYRARTEVYVKLRDEYQNERSLQNAFEILHRSSKQTEVLKTYLKISGWGSGESPKPVTREELMNVSHCNTVVMRSLVDRGIMRLYDVEVGRLNTTEAAHPENIQPLSDAQEKARREIMEGDNSQPVLLHGVTSSGKTEIYIHLIQEAIERGEQVMYLLPEIALTVQMTQRLKKVFGNRLGIYHSRYSDAERVEIWKKQLSDNPYDVILGARSAVFLPYQRLGLVIVDEEHETSFKQQDPSPRYHARSVAMMMARWSNARILLGTATPSAESYYNATNGKYRLVTLTQRYKNLQLPFIHVVDVKDLRHRKMMRGMLSPQLRDAIVEALQNGEQAIVFHNRRGYSPIIECHQCGWSPKCPNCDVSLTYHKTSVALTCHYCGYTYKMPETCPECKNRNLRDRGAGTEKVEDMIAEELGELFRDNNISAPASSGVATKPLRIARMDLDTTRTRNAYERIINEFSSGKSNLLIGTQMVTKGLDFDNVSVVGILSADTMLNQPDFRAYEHAFTMMTQVAGRAGRKGRRGQVFLQTTRPGLPVIRQIVDGDYKGFFRLLMEERKLFAYPPFTRLIDIYLKHKNNDTVNTAAIEMGSRLRQCFGDRVLGPDRPPVARIKTLSIRKIVLKLEPSLSLTQVRQNIKVIADVIVKDARYKGILVSFDVDPG